MRMTLGEKAAKAAKDSQECVTLGRAATRVDCALSYAEYELHKPLLAKIDVNDVSAGFHTSAESAKELLRLSLPKEIHSRVEEYSKEATKTNADFRKKWVGKGAQPFDAEAVRLAQGQAKTLRAKANEIWASVRGLCMDKIDESFKNPPGTAPAGRTGS